jgi:hypothetical protein
VIGSFRTITTPTRITTTDDTHESSKSSVPTSNTVHIRNCYYLHIYVRRNVCRVFPTYELRLNTPADVRVEVTSYVIRSEANQRHCYSIFVQQLTPVAIQFSKRSCLCATRGFMPCRMVAGWAPEPKPDAVKKSPIPSSPSPLLYRISYHGSSTFILILSSHLYLSQIKILKRHQFYTKVRKTKKKKITEARRQKYQVFLYTE